MLYGMRREYYLKMYERGWISEEDIPENALSREENGRIDIGHIRQKQEERGWIGENGKRTQGHINFTTVSRLPINNENEYLEMMDMLLELGIKDKNPQIAEVYFELIRRGESITKQNLWTEKAKELFDIGINSRERYNTPQKETSDFHDRIKCETTELTAQQYLPIEKEPYERLMKLLGSLIIADDPDTLDKHSQQNTRNTVNLFLNLQRRATNVNGFKPNDELLDITKKIQERTDKINSR